MNISIDVNVEPISDSSDADFMTLNDLRVDGFTAEQNNMLLRALPRELERAFLIAAAGPPVERRQTVRRVLKRRSGTIERRELHVVAIGNSVGYYIDSHGRSVVDKRVLSSRRCTGRRVSMMDRRRG